MASWSFFIKLVYLCIHCFTLRLLHSSLYKLFVLAIFYLKLLCKGDFSPWTHLKCPLTDSWGGKGLRLRLLECVQRCMVRRWRVTKSRHRSRARRPQSVPRPLRSSTPLVNLDTSKSLYENSLYWVVSTFFLGANVLALCTCSSFAYPLAATVFFTLNVALLY